MTAWGALIGDSITANLGPGESNPKLSPSARSQARNFGVSGHTVAQIYADWLACWLRGDARLKWVFIGGPANDIVQGRSRAQIAADYATLISDVQTQNPAATIFLCKATPMHTYLVNTGGAPMYQMYLDVATDLAATYPTLYNTTIHDALADGNDDLQSTYGGAGNLHPNTAGSTKIVDTLYTWLTALSGGWT